MIHDTSRESEVESVEELLLSIRNMISPMAQTPSSEASHIATSSRKSQAKTQDTSFPFSTHGPARPLDPNHSPSPFPPFPSLGDASTTHFGDHTTGHPMDHFNAHPSKAPFFNHHAPHPLHPSLDNPSSHAAYPNTAYSSKPYPNTAQGEDALFLDHLQKCAQNSTSEHQRHVAHGPSSAAPFATSNAFAHAFDHEHSATFDASFSHFAQPQPQQEHGHMVHGTPKAPHQPTFPMTHTPAHPEHHSLSAALSKSTTTNLDSSMAIQDSLASQTPYQKETQPHTSFTHASQTALEAVIHDTIIDLNRPIEDDASLSSDTLQETGLLFSTFRKRVVPRQEDTQDTHQNLANTAQTFDHAHKDLESIQAFISQMLRQPLEEAIAHNHTAVWHAIEKLLPPLITPFVHQWLDQNLTRIVRESVERMLAQIQNHKKDL
jgi:hypothetical protein